VNNRPGEPPVIDKTYEFLLWTCRHIEKFPRSHRHSLGVRLEERLSGVLDLLIRSRYQRAARAGRAGVH
jgi:hypothetical protein